MEIPKIVTKLNDRLGRSLGRNPHGEPLYKWVYADDWFHWMRDISGYKEVRKLSGVISMEPIYKQRRMCPTLHDVWVVAHWHAPESELSWRIKYGSDALWSGQGYWSPVNAWSEIGQLPTDSLTDRFIEIVSKRRAMTAQEVYDEGVREVDAIERSQDNLRADIIDDACTAFGAIPGSRAGGVSFPLPGVNYAVQENHAN
jgi:hypothetical protein